nr:hypothetical protein [Tanacetum cinerariifolium]
MASMPSANPMLVDLNETENVFKKLFELLEKNSKRASIFYTSPEEFRLTDVCVEAKLILQEWHLYFEIFQNRFKRDVKEMNDVFVLVENDLDENFKQNKLLKDRLLEASLSEDIKNLVITSCVDGGPIAPIAIQATNFGLRNDMIQQVHNSCQFHGLLGDDANNHLEKFLLVTQSIKVNGVTDDALHLYLFPHSLTHHATACQRPDESLFEAWERYKLSIDRCPNHNMLPVTQMDTFYNGLTLRHRDTINAAAGGAFMKRRPEECYDLIENMTAHHNDWDTSAQRSESSSSITFSSDTEIAALKAEMAEINKNLMRVL